MNRISWLILLAILALALGLRIWGIGFGLPYPYHVDEPTYVSAALNLGAGIIGRQPNPTGFSNILFGEYAGYYLAGRLTGLFSSTAAFEQAYRSDPSIFLLLGRLTSAFFGALTVLVIYVLGARANRRMVGWLAALFLAVAFLHVRDSHYGVPDVTTTFFASLAVLFCVLASHKHSSRYLCVAAAAAGYAIATKWSVWPVGIPLFLAFVQHFWQQGRPTSTPLSRQLLGMFVIALCFAGGFAAGGFQVLIKPATYLEYALREARAGEAGGFGLWQIDTVPGWEFYLKTLLYGLDLVLLILGIAGFARRTVLAVARREATSVLLISFPLMYFLVMGSTQHYFARYALPLIPFVALYAAEATSATHDWLSVKNRSLAWATAAALVILALAFPLLRSIQHDIVLTQIDTRTIAKDWIEENIPSGAKIAADWPMHTPPLATSDQSTSDRSVAYNVQYIGGSGLSDHDLDWYRRQGYDYLIASSFIYNIPLVFPKRDTDRKSFYASLPQRLELVKEFSADPSGDEPPFLFDEIYGPVISLWQRERPGPTIRVYQIANNR
jgi:hypothetical protein